jgi:Protein of unknown function (DUF3175)
MKFDVASTHTGSPVFSCPSSFSRISVAEMKRKEASMRDGKRRRTGRNTKRWVAKVKTDSTHPPPGLFTKSASTISRVLASKEVSPKGPQSGMRMLNYFINRGGRGIPPARRAELEKAKSLLSKRIARSKAS